MINVQKLTEELLYAGLLIHGIDVNEVISWQDGHPIGTDEADAQAVIDAHDPTDLDEALKPQIRNAVQSLAGVLITDMTVDQLKLLLFALAYKRGAIDPSDLTIRPVGEWIR